MSDKTPNKIGWVAVVVIGVLMAVGLGWSYNKQGHATNKVEKQQEEQVDFDKALYEFLRKQCLRDDFRDSVIVQALEDAKRRAISSIENPTRRQFEVGRIQSTIDLIEAQAGACLKTIPGVNSEK